MSLAPIASEAHFARLNAMDARLTMVENTLGLFRRETDGMSLKIDKISSTVEALANDTAEMVSLFKERKAAFNFFARVARLVRAAMRFVVLSALGVFVAVYALMHDGEMPEWIAKVLKAIE